MKKLIFTVLVVLGFLGYKAYEYKQSKKVEVIVIEKSAIDKAMPFIKKFEGFSAVPYLCSDKEVVIGYGTHISKVKSKKVTEAEASAILKESLTYFSEKIDNVYFKNVPLSDDKKIALLSLLYNLGETKFHKSLLYTMLLNEKLFTSKVISREWSLYNRAKIGGKKIVVKGLKERRLAEINLYFNKSYGQR